MKILAIDSAAKTASVCLWEDGHVRAHVFQGGGYTHSVTLMPMVDTVLQLAGATLSEVDRLAVSKGPGSFTGLRIGIGTVKGLCMAADKHCVPVSTLLAMAYGHRDWQGTICAAMDARAGQVYAALFAMENGVPRRLTEDEALPASEMAARLDEMGGVALLAGDGGPLVQALLRQKGVLTPLETQSQTAVGVALAALEESPISGERLLPSYLRRPQAERERNAANAAQV